MAVLEFEFKGIDQNFRSSASNVLNDIDKIKKAFGSIGSGAIDNSGITKSFDEVKIAIKQAESDNRMFLANKLADTRQAGIEEANAIKNSELQKQQAYKTTSEAWKASALEQKSVGVDLDNQRKQSLLNIAKLNEEQKRYNATQREAREATKSIVYPIDSVVGMRNRLNELRAIHDKLSESQRNGTRVQSNLVTEINRLNTAVSKAEQATGRYQRNVGNYQQAQSGANGVAMEFNRIIQDAPFGMMGIGNNIQQLAANWASYAQQQRTAADGTKIAVSNMTLLKGAMATIFSPANALVLGISALTSAWTYYSMNTEKATKSSLDLSNSFANQLGVLNNLNNLMKASAKTDRDKATAVAMYNKELGDTLGKVKSYGELEQKLIKNGSVYIQYLMTKAKAEAAYQLSIKNTISLLEAQNSLQNGTDNWFKKAGNWANKGLFKLFEGKDVKDTVSQVDWNKLMNLKTLKEVQNATKDIYTNITRTDIIEAWTKNQKSSNFSKMGTDFTQQANALADLAKLKMPTFDITDKKGNPISDTTKNLKDQRDYLLEIQQILQNSQTRVDTEGEIINWDKELIKVHDYYDSQTIALDKMLVSSQRAYKDDAKKREEIEKAINATKLTLHTNMINELSKIDDKYFNKGKDLINDLINTYGDKPIESALDKELKKNKLEFSKKREQAIELKVSQDDLDMLDKLERDEDKNIKIKFSIQYLEEIDKLEKQIQDLVNKPFSSKNKDGLIKQTEERKKEVQALYDVLVQVMKLGYDGKGTGGFKLSEEDIQKTAESLKLQIEANAKKQKEDGRLEKDIQDYTNILKTGVDNVFTNLKTNIDEFGWKARSVFYTLGETVGDVLKQLANKNTAKFMEKLTEGAKDFKGLADNFKDMWKKDKGQVIGAGLGMAGNAILSMSSPSDSVGQGLGGALTGAAAGATMGSAVPGIGTAVGAAAGAVVGGISGLLKAAKSKRQEKIIQEQLEEQKKANRLLERMSALTYASQIIGQKTEYGIVSGVRRNEFGQIVSVVQGQDIIMVADRTNKQKGR